jgi:cytochrome P450
MQTLDLIPQVEVAPAEDARRRQRFPRGAAISFADMDEHSRAGALDDLRSQEPVSWVPALGGWLVTGHALAREVLSPRSAFSVWAAANLVRASLGVMMLTSDGESHDRQRAPFDEPFRMRPVHQRFAEPVAARLKGLLDDLRGRGACDLSADLAAPFAIGAAGDVLGLGLDDVPRMREFYDAFAGAMVYDGDPEPQRRADVARAELNDILAAEIERARRRPDDSITSAVANDPASGLDDAALAAQLRVILFGAIETVESLVLNTVLLLLSHPDQLAAVRERPELLDGAVDESMRAIPPVAFVERWTAAPAVLGGVELGVGEFVGISVVAANRDPDVFADPLAFDVRRRNARHHLAFSFGLHHCLGFNLARMQGGMAVQAILELPGLELEQASEPRGFAFRKPDRLLLRWRGASS